MFRRLHVFDGALGPAGTRDWHNDEAPTAAARLDPTRLRLGRPGYRLREEGPAPAGFGLPYARKEGRSRQDSKGGTHFPLPVRLDRDATNER
jgi:hypothetical protein